jgi:hypothetical protein
MKKPRMLPGPYRASGGLLWWVGAILSVDDALYEGSWGGVRDFTEKVRGYSPGRHILGTNTD